MVICIGVRCDGVVWCAAVCGEAEKATLHEASESIMQKVRAQGRWEVRENGVGGGRNAMNEERR